MVKNPPATAGDVRDVDLILGSGRSPREGHGNPLQYSYLENPMNRGAWRATVHGVTQSWTQLKQLSTHVRIATSRIVVVMFPPFFSKELKTGKQACLQCASNQPHYIPSRRRTDFYQPAQQPREL